MLTRALAFVVVVSAFAGAAAAADGDLSRVADHGLADPGLARAVAAGELPFDVLFLPEGFHGNLPSYGLHGIDDVTGTSLPGPGHALIPSGDNGRSLLTLIHASGTLADLPSADLQGLLAAPAYSAPDAQTTTSPSTPTTHTVDGPADTASSDATGAYAPDTAAADEETSTHSTDTAPATSGNAAIDAWNELTPEQKAAVGAGALGLLLMAPFAMYSRIKRDEALKNPTRAKIYEIVCSTPGLCKKDIAQRSDVSYSTATYHLDRLQKDDYIVEMDEGNKVTYFKNGGRFSPAERELVPVLKNEEAMRVLETVLANPWCYRAQVAEMLDVSHTTVNWHLKRLADAGLVTEHREGRACHLMVPDEALDRLERVMDKLDGSEGHVQIARIATVTA